eukprot:TRINITY_DN3490_c0_g1_i3.p1 TRINITY_DN3490_c0_g1~~TRINITY_DN3490_c0_g1_i3.p1  ORF type:complete len:467 (+),score=135.59 TRINITY_DN3490_c0_g1_i3:185-1402(+)
MEGMNFKKLKLDTTSSYRNVQEGNPLGKVSEIEGLKSLEIKFGYNVKYDVSNFIKFKGLERLRMNDGFTKELNKLEQLEIPFCETLTELDLTQTRDYDKEYHELNNANEGYRPIFLNDGFSQNIHLFTNLRKYRGLPSPDFDISKWLDEHFPKDQESKVLRKVEFLGIPTYEELILRFFHKERKIECFPQLINLDLGYIVKSYNINYPEIVFKGTLIYNQCRLPDNLELLRLELGEKDGDECSLDFLKNLTKLKYLVVALPSATEIDKKFEKIYFNNLEPLLNLQSLRFLEITGETYEFENLPEETREELGGKDEGWNVLGKLENLEYLDISAHYDIGNSFIAAISSLKYLSYLNLSECGYITDISPLSELPNLKFLNSVDMLRLKKVFGKQESLQSWKCGKKFG